MWRVYTTHASNKFSSFTTNKFVGCYEDANSCTPLFSISNVTRSIASMQMLPEPSDTNKVSSNVNKDTGELSANLLRPNGSISQSDLKEIATFQSEGMHTDTSLEDLCQRWCISVA